MLYLVYKIFFCELLYGRTRCGSAAGVNARLLAGTAARCSRLMDRRKALGQKADGNPQRRFHSCQEQIELSGFVANDLSAFSVLRGSPIF